MPEPNFQNRTLYHGDNLDFLRGMNSETVHLIATDPPFNKNRDFHATPDSLAAGARFKDRWRWDSDVHEDWTDGIKDDWPAAESVIAAARLAYGDDMGAFLCWMGVRLMEMHRVLRHDGSIYVHCDHTAHAWLKCLMDAVFGRNNFRNEVVWGYRTQGVAMRWWPRKHDTLLFYTKGDAWTFHPQMERQIYKKPFRHTKRDADGNYYVDTYRRDVWDHDETRPTISQSPERTGYPTQKPLALYERIIAASSNKDDMVLDPFCGCATTPVAAERLKRQWVGMDIWDGALDVVKERMERDTILRSDASNHVTLPQVHYETTAPRRSDSNELAAPSLKLRTPRAMAAWQKLTHRQIVHVLLQAQRSNGNVICAGCGRELEREFMELDHIHPRSDGGENHINNRILLCRPCNGKKGQYLTLRGLLRENKKAGWMIDEGMAQMAREAAREKAEWLRDNFATEACQNLISGGALSV
ncbi:MAG: DNA methyltransferase [Chloroflexi bacterium]|nr:DNA methyltransferase [Chloroflexota bacterium]